MEVGRTRGRRGRRPSSIAGTESYEELAGNVGSGRMLWSNLYSFDLTNHMKKIKIKNFQIAFFLNLNFF